MAFGRWFVFSLTSLLLAFGLFQNCAESLDLSELDQASLGKSFPFAYDAKIDTFGYLSCADMGDNFDRAAYFTYRVGAFDEAKSGIRLSEEFLDKTKPYSPEQKTLLLQESEDNNNIQLQFSIRKRTDLRVPEIMEGSSVVEGRDVINFLSPLDTPALAAQLVQANGRNLSAFSGSGLQSRTFDGSLSLNKYPTGLQVTLSNYLLNDYIFALTYSAKGEARYQARSPADLNGASAAAQRRVYGIGYRVRMTQPASFQGAENMGNRVVSQIDELHLDPEKGTEDLRTWTCNQSLYSFTVVRPQDAPANCSKIEDNQVPPEQIQTLALIRRLLPPEDWYVDLNRRCIVPKRSGKCYGEVSNDSSSNYSVRYAPPAGAAPTCNLFNRSNTVNTDMCPHFFSICHRN